MTVLVQLVLTWIGLGAAFLLGWCLRGPQIEVSVWEQRTSREDEQPWCNRNLN